MLEQQSFETAKYQGGFATTGKCSVTKFCSIGILFSLYLEHEGKHVELK